ncbi:MAG: lysylphosphatidylglycerol synthase transmembrane domain-containing protein [Chloroflexota bacterium]|nr:lysylphosphatidylglycerol synthase transmembrane domain-containing protein [Chloroflexota bacterium]
MLRSGRFWIGVAITILFLFLFVYQIRGDFAEMGQALAAANYVFLLPALLIYMVGVYFRAVRWRYLLKPIKTLSSIRLFPLILIGMLVNNILPARLGIVARAYILGEREGISKMATGGTMVLEQAFDGITLVIFAAVISFFAPLEGVLQQVIYITASIFLGAIAVCFVLALSPRLARTAIGLVLRLLPHGWRPKGEIWLVRLVEGLGIMRSPGKLALVFVLSVLVWACEAGMFYMVAFSFDLRLPFYAFMLATSVANLAWALVMSQGGLGSFDLAAQKTIELFNVGPALAASYVVVLHAFILLATIPVGFVFLWLENVSLTKIVLGHDRSQQVREGEPPEEGKEKR